MKAYAGIDLHARNNSTGVINEPDQRLFGKRLPNRLESFLKTIGHGMEAMVFWGLVSRPGAVLEPSDERHWP